VLPLLFFSLLDAANVALARCDTAAPVLIARKSGLPVDVISALPSSMSDRGQAHQSGDIVADAPLPLHRLVTAEKQGCNLWATYEHGGRGHNSVTLKFDQGQTKWQAISYDHDIDDIQTHVLKIIGSEKSTKRMLITALLCGDKSAMFIPGLRYRVITTTGSQSGEASQSCIRKWVSEHPRLHLQIGHVAIPSPVPWRDPGMPLSH
jgi:hypothetical protein